MAHRPASRWLVRSSAIAISFGCLSMAGMDRGSAQSFQGTANVVAGQVDSLTTGAGTTDILINGATPQVVIDWTPTDTSAGATPIAFQNAGTTATFSRDGGSDFAVLNRILPSGAASGRAVLLDGNIQGQVGISAPQPGGTIYFYTPSGLVIGSNAQIDVGQLGLTTSDIQYTTGFTGEFIAVNAGGTVTFTGANAGSYVSIQPNAQINALVDTSSYVAIFAPTILQGGAINVNGSTALVAAEAGTLRWSGGLFDVAVTTGTDGDGSNQAIFHTGSTGGPASSGSAGDNHRIYTVAVPKNTAITTLIASGSSLGFDVAGAADTVGNAVILTGGYDLSAGSPSLSGGAGTGSSSVQVTNTTVTSSLSLHATAFGAVEAVAGGSSALASDLFVRSLTTARVEASSPASTLNIAGNVFLDATRSVNSGAVTGGNSLLMATGGGTLIIGGSAALSSSANTGGGSTATGGLARVLVDGGSSLTIGTDLSLASLGTISETETGNAFGGMAEIVITESGSNATINGNVDLATAGLGGGIDGLLSTGVAGGEGRGGTSRILVNTGPNSLTVVGGVIVEANGRGGDGNLAASGNGFGGGATISAGAGSSITFQSDVLMEAAGTSGSVSGGFNSIIANATSGGNATGGAAGLLVTGTGSVITINGDLTIDANATSDGTLLAGAAGGDAQGGSALIEAGGTGAVTVNGSVSLSVIGNGGIGSTGPGGSGTGGFALVATLNAGASFQAGGADTDFTVSADGEGGFTGGAGVGGQGRGGTAQISATGGDMDISSTIAVFSGGFGGETVNGDAGAGYGGSAQITADAGAVVTLTADLVSVPVVVDAIGVGGSASGSGNGGEGGGGPASIAAFTGGTVDVVGDLVIGAVSEGGDGANGGAGNGLLNPAFGVPAFSGITAVTGTISVSGATSMLAAGTGGDALVAGGAGGTASGGSVSIYSDGSGGAASITLDALTALAEAVGGAGAAGAAGATGGAGGSATAGAIGIGGTADNGDLVTADVSASVSAAGGAGGNGGDNPSATGGTGGMGGNARGGAVIMGLFDSPTVGAPGSATFGDVFVNAVATAGAGGNGGTGLTTDGNGGLGGSAIAAAIGTAPSAFVIDGPSQILARGGSVVMGDYTLLARAIGGAGGSGAAFGQGGNAVAGGFDIDVRAGNASGLAGSLITSDTSADLLATAGGAGGNELFGSGPRVSVKGGSATLLGLTVVQSGDSPVAVPVARNSELSVVDGALNVDTLAIATNGAMSVFLDNGAVFGDSILLSAGTFVDDSAALVPLNPGGLTADFVDIVSSGNIILDAGIVSDADIFLSSSGSIRTYDLLSQGQVFVSANGSAQVRNVNAATDTTIIAAGGLTFNALQAGQDVDLISGDTITGLTIDAGDSVTAEAGNAINLVGGITAGIVNPSGGTGAAYSVGLLANNAINVGGGISAVEQIGIGTQNGSVTGGLLSAGSDILILARGGVTLGAVDAANGVAYIADSSMFALSPSIDPFDPAPILAAAPVAMAGPIIIGDVFGTRVVIATTGDATFGDVFAPDSIFIRGNGVFGVEFSAGNAIRLEAAGLMSMLGAFADTGNIDLLSGGTVFANRIDAGGSVAIQAAQNIALFSDETDTDVVPGAIVAGGTVRLVAQSGSIFDVSRASSGGAPVPPQASITAGGTILALAGDSFALRSLTSSTGGVYIANSSMAQFGGSFDNFNIGAVIGRTPTPVGGSVLLSGNVSGLGMRAASLGAMSVRGVTVTQLAELRTNGLLSLDGVVSGQNIVTSASDIAIGANGRISAPTGSVALLSNNAGGMFVGDTGLTGGYQISAAEFARVSGGSVNIIGLDFADLSIDMVIGDLAVTGPLAGSTVESSNGALRFGTGQSGAQNASGVIRITGSLAARGFTPTNQLGFFTETLQLDANSGLIEILGQGTQLAGAVVLGVDRFHAADATILDRLLENPLYASRIDDINTPLALSRPNGILRSDDLDTDTLSQFLIQNTGTRALPAGILVASEGPIELDFGPLPGSIEFVVNGQTITDDGTLTGTQVFDFLINGSNRGFFAPGSTINGCLISGTTCVLTDPEPDVTEMDTEFLPSDSITHFTQEPAREEQAVDPEEREEAEEEAKRAPIPPPTPIISTQPLAPVIDVDEPVAGAGNPGLISSVPTPAGQGRETAQ